MGKGSLSAVNLLNEARRDVLDKPGIKQEKVSSKKVKELLAMDTGTHARTHVRSHARTHMYVHTHTHTHTYVHAHTSEM